MAESQPFSGFPVEGLQFLRTLGTNDTVWLVECGDVHRWFVQHPS